MGVSKGLKEAMREDGVRKHLVHQFETSNTLPTDIRYQQAEFLFEHDRHVGEFEKAAEWLHIMYALEPSEELALRIANFYADELNDPSIVRGLQEDATYLPQDHDDGWYALHAHMRALRFS